MYSTTEETGVCLRGEVNRVELIEDGLTLTRQRCVLQGGNFAVVGEGGVMYSQGDHYLRGLGFASRNTIPSEAYSISVLLFIEVHRDV